MRKYLAYLAALLVSVLPSFAFAVIDVADITDKIAEVETAIAAVGIAVLVMFAGIKVWKWIRGSM